MKKVQKMSTPVVNKIKKNKFQLRVKLKPKKKINEDEVKSGGVEQQLHVEDNLDEPESESDSNEVEDVNLQKVEEQRQIWKIGGWDIDPDQGHPYGPRIHLESSSTKNEIDYFLHFFPLSHLRDVMVPATNTFARDGWTLQKWR